MRTLLLFAVIVYSPVASAAAQQAPTVPRGTVVAYISGQRVSNETTEGKDGLSRIRVLQQERADQLKAKQQALDATRQQLAAAEDAAARARLLQQELDEQADLQKSTVQAQTDVQNLQRQIAADLQAGVRAELTEMLKGTDVQVVVQFETAIIWAAPGLDLTSAVIERLNAKAAAAAGGGAR